MNEKDEPLFSELEEYLRCLDFDPAWITFNPVEQMLNIYVKDTGYLEDHVTQNISDDYMGLAIRNKWNELAASHNYLNEVSDNVEVMVQNFAKKYLIFLTESCTNAILAKLRDSKLAVKPVHFFCGATACYTIIYSNLHEYEQSIVTGSVFKLMDIIDDALIAADTLNLYKHRTVKLEILHMDMPGLEIFGMDTQFWPESN